MAATLDGLVEETGAVFEAKFMLPWSFSEQAAAEKHMAQLQHNMMVVGSKNAVLSIITGGGKWVEIAISADPVYQTAMMYAERAFWRAVSSGEPPRLFHAEPPRARIEAVKIVDMSTSNAWAEFAALFRSTRPAFLEHERVEGRAQDPDAGGCQGGDRPRHSGQALQIRRGELRSVWRWPMPRSSESVAALASALGQGPGRADQSGKVADRNPAGRARPAGAQRSAMRRCRAGWRSSARRWGGMRSRPSNRPRSTATAAPSSSPPRWRMPRANGLPRIGRSVRWPTCRRRTAWEPR